jgi:hypothetical protein
MDDFLRRMQEQQEMFRRLAEGPLRYIRENEATIRRMQELTKGLDTEQFQRVIEAFGSRSSYSMRASGICTCPSSSGRLCSRAHR